MPGPSRAAVPVAVLHDRVLTWYAAHKRTLPWRDGGTDAWGVLVSEVMLQQTPVVRVEPVWRAWMERWPTPVALAAETPGEVVRAWGRLGYPRRALRLREAAVAITRDHAGRVPDTEEALLGLPGVGTYTAAAVAAFAHGRRTVVVDTNVRRVLARALEGRPNASPSLTAAESRLAAATVPAEAATSVRWNVAVMELGAVVCRARTPECGACPLEDVCAWVAAGSPPDDGPPRRGQAWHGTDRQVRGALVQVLREGEHPVARPLLEDEVLTRLGLDPAQHAAQVERCLGTLVEDGLVEPVPASADAPGGEAYRLPA